MTASRIALIPLLALAIVSPGCVGNSPLDLAAVPDPADLSRSQSMTRSEPQVPAWASPLRVGAVTTVASPESPPKRMSLTECLALALESGNGRTGEFFDMAGSERRTSVTGSGRAVAPTDTSDSMRVFAFDPALMATETEQSLARFDAVWTTEFNWFRTNRLSQQLNPTPADELQLKDQLDAVGFRTSLLKPLATGGVAGL